jgi:hypothetical protein
MKESHKTNMAESLKSFQSKAFGDTTSECIEKIEKEINAKY